MMLQMAAAKQWGQSQLRQARSADGRHVAAGCDHRAAQRRRRHHQRIQRAAVPVSAARERGHPHGAELLRGVRRSAHLHAGLDVLAVPRQEPCPLQGAGRRLRRGDADAEQGCEAGRAVLDRQRQVEAAGREGCRDRLRPSSEMDHGAREHHEVRRVHARSRLDQGHARNAGKTCSFPRCTDCREAEARRPNHPVAAVNRWRREPQ